MPPRRAPKPRARIIAPPALLPRLCLTLLVASSVAFGASQYENLIGVEKWDVKLQLIYDDVKSERSEHAKDPLPESWKGLLALPVRNQDEWVLIEIKVGGAGCGGY